MAIGYKSFAVWKKSMELVKIVYQITKDFPRDEIHGLISQMRRCAVSIPSNIAEGYRRNTKQEFVHFLRISYGSGGELETQLEIAEMLNYSENEKISKVEALLVEIMKLLNTMIKNPRV